MEHPCYKCGVSVEDGTPFCPRCNAPQIKVAGNAPLAPTGTTPEIAIEQYASHAPPPTALEWSDALPCAGIAVLAAIFVMILGLPAGLGMLGAGFLSVLIYRRRCPATHVTTGMGARLGALTGGVGFGVLAAILALWTAFRSGKEIRDAFLNYLQQYVARNPDPHVQQFLDLFNTPEGFTVIMILILVMTLIAFLIFSTIGGAVAAFLLHRKERL